MNNKALIFIIVGVVGGCALALMCVGAAIIMAPRTPSAVVVSTGVPIDEPPATEQSTEPTAEPLPTDTAIPLDTPTPTNNVGRVGDTMTQEGYIITLTNIETATAFGDFSTAAEGNQFVAVELLIESAADSGVHVNPFYVTVKDSEGYEYNGSVFGQEPTLNSQNDLPRGEIMRGWVTFEIPLTATGLILTYEPLTVGGDVRIRFDLGM
jgi:hypothetical protein